MSAAAPQQRHGAGPPALSPQPRTNLRPPPIKASPARRGPPAGPSPALALAAMMAAAARGPLAALTQSLSLSPRGIFLRLDAWRGPALAPRGTDVLAPSCAGGDNGRRLRLARRRRRALCPVSRRRARLGPARPAPPARPGPPRAVPRPLPSPPGPSDAAAAQSAQGESREETGERRGRAAVKSVSFFLPFFPRPGGAPRSPICSPPTRGWSAGCGRPPTALSAAAAGGAGTAGGPAERKGGKREGGRRGRAGQTKPPASDRGGLRGGETWRGGGARAWRGAAPPPSSSLPPSRRPAGLRSSGGRGGRVSGLFLWFLSPFSFLSDGDARSSRPALPATWRGAAGASPSGALGGGPSRRALLGRVRAVPGPVCEPKFCSWNGAGTIRAYRGGRCERCGGEGDGWYWTRLPRINVACAA